MFNWIIVGMLSLLAVWTTVWVFYQLVLACLYFLVPDEEITTVEPRNRFAVIIPAHDEEMTITRALNSWNRIHYPSDLFAVHVIADNCTDRTAEIARAHEAICCERHNAKNTGKGHALAWALEILSLDAYDAVVFVDADTTVDPELLCAMNNRLISGASVIQGFDAVRNPNDSPMTRLMQVTNVMKNLLFNHAKSKLGLSVQLMGTGMCFRRDVLQQIGWKAFSIGEDGEQFAYLAGAGIRVEYEPKAIVFAEEASSFGEAYTQRVRWSSGRMQLMGVGARLFIQGLRKGDLRLMDAALTFLIPNYAMLANMTLFGIVMTSLVEMHAGSFLLLWFLFLLGAQVLYFFTGVRMSNIPVRALGSLTFAPMFLMWKILIDVIAILHVRDSAWVRAYRRSETKE